MNVSEILALPLERLEEFVSLKKHLMALEERLESPSPAPAPPAPKKANRAAAPAGKPTKPAKPTKTAKASVHGPMSQEVKDRIAKKVRARWAEKKREAQG